MAIYQFILSPLDKFYYGKERHPIRPSYYMESNPFAQQTGLLGLTRHFMLLATNIFDDKAKWDACIGAKSFDGSNEQTFGKIKRIFPVFIYNDSNRGLLPAKQLSKLFFANKTKVKVSYDNSTEKSLYLLSRNKGSEKIEDQLNLKENYFEDEFVIDRKYNQPIPMYCKTDNEYTSQNLYGYKPQRLNLEKGVFIKHLQPGILKSYQANEENEDAYFKIQYLKLNKGYHFSFLAEIDEEIKNNTSFFMTSGGENSAFKVSVKKDVSEEEFYGKCNAAEGNGNIFHFISDTIISKEAFENISQFVGETKYFRPMKTDYKNNRSELYKVNRDLDKFDTYFHKSQLLLKKGSFAFVCTEPESIENFRKSIEDPKYQAYRNIGYNYYKQLKSLTNEQQ